MKKTNIIDISMDLNAKTIVWTADPPPNLKPILRKPKDECNFTWLDFGSHAGTHIDAPYYLYSKKWTTDKIPFARLMGACQVLDLTDVSNTITVQALKRHAITRRIILLKTKNSYDPMKKYNPQHVDLSPEGADYLVKKGVLTLGYDYQSFEREGKNILHRIFISRSITLIDNLRLKHAREKEYFLICLPIKVTGIDGAPARAILLEQCRL